MSIPFRLALLLGAATGFIALAHEIVWTRVYNFTSASSAQALGTMLGSYLLGLALGSLWSRRWQDSTASDKPRLRALALLLIYANIAAFLVVPAISWLVTLVEWPQTLPLVMASAALMGTVFPLLCHLAIPADSQSGARMSYLYLANIVGSGLGSLLTGFVLMEWLALWQIAALLLVIAAVIGFALLRLVPGSPKTDAIPAVLALALAGCAPLLYSHLYERLQLKAAYATYRPFTEIIESRHGVITIVDNKIICGNGIYDGMLETNPRTGGSLYRPYFISAVHAAPREVLVIGVSGGAWTQILAHNPMVERVTAVEISDAYIKLIQNHSLVSSILTNPKVHIVIDDGRRWLRRNPDRHFDVIVMNTTFHWREFSSALLGREFLELARSRLNPGGIVMWNCTGSERAARTGMTVFPHTMMLGNNCIASLSPLVIDPERWRRVLRDYRIDGHPVYDLNTPDGQAGLEEMISLVTNPTAFAANIQTRDQMEKLYGTAEIITDDNLGHEYKFTLQDIPRLKKLLFLSAQ
jgi:spermidine synthase